MADRRRIFIIIPVGLIIGLGLGWVAWGPQDRAEAVIASLEKYCMGFVFGTDPVSTQGLRDVSVFPGEQRWFDKRTGLAIEFDDTRCGISDLFDPLDDGERAKAVALAVALGMTMIPNATTEDRADTVEADLFKSITVTDDEGANPGFLVVRWMQDPSDITQTATSFTFTRPTVGGDDA